MYNMNNLAMVALFTESYLHGKCRRLPTDSVVVFCRAVQVRRHQEQSAVVADAQLENLVFVGAGFDVGIAVGSMGITTELASRRTDPTSDLNEMSFNETIFILPPRDSRWTPCGPWSSNDRVGDSSLRKKTK
jgi:hypothetical protein